MSLQRKYKGERTYAWVDDKGWVCEYVSGIENTGEEFSRFITVNFNFFYFLFYGIVMKFTIDMP